MRVAALHRARDLSGLLGMRGRNFLKQPLSRKFLAMEALGCLGAAKLTTKLVPLRHFRVLFNASTARPARLTPAELRDLAWSIESMSEVLPVRMDCLPQALALQLMLLRRSAPGKICFGVKKGKGGEVAAHAWLTLQGHVLVGALPDLDSYVPFPDWPMGR